MAERGMCSATGMTMAAIVIGLSITEEMSVEDQNAVANLLFVAAQAISTRASLLPPKEASTGNGNGNGASGSASQGEATCQSATSSTASSQGEQEVRAFR